MSKQAEEQGAEPDEAAPEQPEQGRRPAGGAFNPFIAPSRDLVSAYLLLLLRNWSMHGYQLMQQLMQFGYQPSDPGGIYRLLRQLERQGFIRSSWEAGEAGPARRMYTITDAGNAFLGTWATAIESYQKTLKFWTDIYAGVATPPGTDPSRNT